MLQITIVIAIDVSSGGGWKKADEGSSFSSLKSKIKDTLHCTLGIYRLPKEWKQSFGISSCVIDVKNTSRCVIHVPRRIKRPPPKEMLVQQLSDIPCFDHQGLLQNNGSLL